MLTETEEKVPHAESALSQLPALLKRFCDQFLKLFETQLTLFKTELKGAVRVYTKHLILTMASGLVAAVGFSFLSIGLALWVDRYINNLAISFGCVGGAYLTIGVTALAAARRMTRQAPVLNQTREELERDQQWIKTETHQAR
jgi:uncharacterized membrane protein YqjE